MNPSGFLECIVCGSSRLAMFKLTEEERPPAVTIDIECSDCNHQFVLDLSQATEQLSLNFFPAACPTGCTDEAKHQRL
jgi:peroxiredoxin